MTNAPLALLSTGTYLPAAYSTHELALVAGADPSGFQGWERVHVASNEEHPSVMGTAAVEEALAAARMPISQVKLVLAAGTSRDYPPSWSVATEIMSRCGAPGSCVGLDLTIGCLGSIAALNLALGWLSLNAGVAVVVAAERWSYTVDRSRNDLQGLWGHSDGAAAAVVAVGLPSRTRLAFVGAEFVTNCKANGYVLVKYGGTRYPIAPPGEAPYERRIDRCATAGLRDSYVEGYRRAFEALRRRFDYSPVHLVSNQPSRSITARLPELAGVSPTDAVQSGPQHGHLGAADVLLGLHLLLHTRDVSGPVVVAGSTPYAFGAGLFV
jgi:3-oxoacyl-[acyl-carrier-protein] synthase III